jgi:Tol biopolymer transport system component
MAMCCALMGVGLIASPAQAAFPGQNGKLAFANGGNVMTVQPDGTNLTSLGPGNAPAWSPDGQKIAFVGLDGSLWVMSADGSNRVEILNRTDLTDVAWSPDATQLVYRTLGCVGPDCFGVLHVVNSDGSGDIPISTRSGMPSDPNWSPDGSQIAYWSDFSSISTGTPPDIFTFRPGSGETQVTHDGKSFWASWAPSAQRILFVSHDNSSPSFLRSMNPDGSGRTTIPGGELARYPTYSPDGTRIAYLRFELDSNGQNPQRDIWVMNADGSNGGSIYHTTGFGNTAPDWQPIPVNSYPRPKGATPFQTYLVPAYEPCTSPNRAHGPPLAFPSCNQPTSTSSLTVGTPDANAKPAKSVSVVRFSTVAGNPATAADEADVMIDATINDVYQRTSVTDYTGDLTVATPLRITDKLNTPHPGGPGAATVSDTTLGFDLPCTATADTTVGSTCALSTTYDALVPGAVTEARRSIWALGQVQVRDSGGAPFMRQGIFVP